MPKIKPEKLIANISECFGGRSKKCLAQPFTPHEPGQIDKALSWFLNEISPMKTVLPDKDFQHVLSTFSENEDMGRMVLTLNGKKWEGFNRFEGHNLHIEATMVRKLHPK